MEIPLREARKELTNCSGGYIQFHLGTHIQDINREVKPSKVSL